MAFQAIQKTKPSFGRAPLSKSVKAYILNGMCSLSLSEDVFSAIGNPPFFRILVGTGADAGCIALVPTFKKMPGANRARKANQNSKASKITVMAHLIGLDVQKMNTVACDFRINDGDLIVSLAAIKSQAAPVTRIAA